MRYSAKAVANYFLKLAKTSGASLTPLKLQKLVYFAHGWHLALFKQPLLDERVEAWRYGPVVPTIYREFRSAGAGEISSFATEYDWDLGIVVPEVGSEDTNTKQFLEKIWDVYGKYTAIQLSNMTHEAGTPWAETYVEGGPRNVDIDDELIRAHFEHQIEQPEDGR